MNELDRMRKLAGILTESVMAVPAIGNQEDNMQTVGTIGRDNADASFDAAQPAVDEGAGNPLDAMFNVFNARLQELLSSGVDPQEAVDVIQQEMDQEGIEADQQDAIMDMLNDSVSNSDSGDNDNNTCVACNGSGEGQYDGTRCSSCGGSGVDQGEQDDDDFDPPDDDGDDYIGPFEEAAPEHEFDEAFDLQNGYDDEHDASGNDYFPNGADSPVVSRVGPSGARHGDNPEQKKMAVAETHKELVYNYRKFIKESSKK